MLPQKLGLFYDYTTWGTYKLKQTQRLCHQGPTARAKRLEGRTNIEDQTQAIGFNPDTLSYPNLFRQVSRTQQAGTQSREKSAWESISKQLGLALDSRNGGLSKLISAIKGQDFGAERLE